MDFITIAPVADPTWAVITATVGLFLILASMLMMKAPSDAVAATGLAVGFAGIVGIAVGLTVMFFSNGAAQASSSQWQSDVKDEVKDVYGIELTAEEFKALDFPTQKPDEDFVAYGTISETTQVGDNFERYDITLIWANDELLLASSVDGEQFTPLDAEGR